MKSFCRYYCLFKTATTTMCQHSHGKWRISSKLAPQMQTSAYIHEYLCGPHVSYQPQLHCTNANTGNLPLLKCTTIAIATTTSRKLRFVYLTQLPTALKNWVNVRLLPDACCLLPAASSSRRVL